MSHQNFSNYDFVSTPLTQNENFDYLVRLENYITAEVSRVLIRNVR